MRKVFGSSAAAIAKKKIRMKKAADEEARAAAVMTQRDRFDSPEPKKENHDLTHILPSPPKSILKQRSLRTSIGCFQPSSSKVCFSLQGDDDQQANEPINENMPKWKLLLNNTKSLISSIAIEDKLVS